MHRIAPRTHSYTHPEANKWLRRFMIDLKTIVYINKDAQPFTMEYLKEWDNHRTDIESCGNFESSLTKSLHDPFVYEHQLAIVCFNSLVIDLMLRVEGLEYKPLTEKRVNEAEKYCFEIFRCEKRQTLFY